LCLKHKQIVFFEMALEKTYKCNDMVRNTQQAQAAGSKHRHRHRHRYAFQHC